MAVVVPVTPQDWKIHREDNMDLPQNSPGQTRQRSPSANESLHQPPFQQQAPFAQQQQQQQQQQPFPFVQQQPGAWTPSATAQPFYPSFYHNPHQQQQYGHSTVPQNQFYDPAHLAQWYQQQMIFSAQQQQQQHGFPRMHQPPPQQHRNPSDFFAPPVPAGYGPFAGASPPQAHPNNPNFHAHRPPNPADQQQYPGFHPYRRPNRQQNPGSPGPSDEWRATAPQRPYARSDAAGSTSSLNSSGSGHHASRQRTDSMQSAHSGYNSSGSNNNNNNVSPASNRSRNGPGASPQALPATRNRTGSNPSSASSSVTTRKQQTPSPHTRNTSSSSAPSSLRSPNSPTSAAAPTTSTTPTSPTASGAVPRPARPSPLSQVNMSVSEKRMSRDDMDLTTMRDSSPNTAMLRSGGLKGRLRRALSFNATHSLKDGTDDEDDRSARLGGQGGPSKLKNSSSASNGRPSMDSTVHGSDTAHDDGESTATVQKKKSRAALFSSRLNASTDNISLSSTVSSASVMIRKLGSMGRLARRNSLAGITSLFKDKKDKAENDKKKKKSAKGEASEPRVSEYTAEVDRSGSDWSGPEMNGLSPAAKLARQHTLKSNAEAAAKLKAQQEVAAKTEQANGKGAGVPTWDNNTSTRAGAASPVKSSTTSVRINEDGTKILVEEDDDYSDDGHYTGSVGHAHHDGWDDDDWGEEDDDEEMTIRQALDRTSLDDGYDEIEPWAINARRSVERTKKPTKGILKYAENFDQERHLIDQSGAMPPATRHRANSYDSTPARSEPGPLAHMPTSDPDHIDGLQRHPSHSSTHHHNQPAPLLPPLGFDSSDSSLLDTTTKPKEGGRSSPASPQPEKANVMFNLPNSSAPALTMLSGSSGAPPLTHRSATAPARRLAFANNLSIYDTFPSSVYDRRSEPATWSRLTPALAQRIKEELNSYKMEEMEVHAASRIHTQFFV